MSADEHKERVKQVLAQEEAWTAAHRPLDREQLREILSESFLKMEPDGRVLDKDQLLKGYDPESRYWQTAESSDHQVTIQGDTALVVGHWRGRGVNQGNSFDYHARFLAVYILEGNDWRLLTEHSTPLEGSSEGQGFES